MNHDDELQLHLQRARLLSASGLESKQIYHQLKSEILPASAGPINEGVLAEVMVKLNLEICMRRSKGIILVAVGVFFIISGFVMSVILVQQGGSIDLFMYGFTTFGILLVGWGGYEVIN